MYWEIEIREELRFSLSLRKTEEILIIRQFKLPADIDAIYPPILTKFEIVDLHVFLHLGHISTQILSLCSIYHLIGNNSKDFSLSNTSSSSSPHKFFHGKLQTFRSQKIKGMCYKRWRNKYLEKDAKIEHHHFRYSMPNVAGYQLRHVFCDNNSVLNFFKTTM